MTILDGFWLFIKLIEYLEWINYLSHTNLVKNDLMSSDWYGIIISI